MKPVSSGRLRSALQPSNAIAVVALVAALGGTAFAAARITGKHIKDNSLTGRDVRNHSLTKKDFKGKRRGGGDRPDGADRDRGRDERDDPDRESGEFRRRKPRQRLRLVRQW